MSRKLARETLMQALFQIEFQKIYDFKAVENFIEGVIDNKKDRQFIEEMVNLFIENKEEIDKNIEENLKGWKLSRISKIDLSILRIAVAEILYREDIPIKVSINEAIELAKKFSEDESPNFINGLLASLVSKKGLNDE
ncbi:NusB antitermination factor [Caminicella sporogenes DSM 14501]|uniref:Transcription antitermination protein NusB n=1 Tax=Caminicella sporogenes DSM 14501 TaxID=1121266 RepID=A0A1M6LLU4_9FIRM|nr:transcription antitermination factor NusB [Caminicella sporogenes]RKD27876.1 transcription antitermination factor NusB [Caminicella sporogenes]WIF94539.1 transcription antitermination factor NusB [Caminicella sporogenes]SHJ72176.1 NusB antitermination factor [Caminicella sporogenes DSM 14501]